MPRTLAGKLAAAFGNVDAMTALYAADVVWSLPTSTGLPTPYKGRDTVVAFNREVWGKYYRADCTIDLLDETGDGDVSAARFIYKAFSLIANKHYENEYTLFVRSKDGRITEVFEAFDTALSFRLYEP